MYINNSLAYNRQRLSLNKITPKVVIVIITIAVSLLYSQVLNQKPKIVLFEFAALGEIPKNETRMLTEEMAKALMRAGDFEIQSKSSSEISKLFTEHGESTPEVIDEALAARAGFWLNVDYIVTGSLEKVAKWHYLISLKSISVQTSILLQSASIKVLDYTQNLVLDRLARLLFWARIRIDCNIPDFEFYVDGVPYLESSKDPDYKVWLVKPGAHKILVKTKRANYSEQLQEITFSPGKEEIVKVTLKNLAGLLELKTIPRSNVYLNDKLIANTTYLARELPEGSYKVTLKASRRIGIETDIRIDAGKKTTISEILPVDLSAYRTPAIVTLSLSAGFAAGGLVSVWQANKSYDKYLETMNRTEMKKYLDRSKTLDKISYGLFGGSGVFAIWSLIEWAGLITNSREAQRKLSLSKNLELRYSLEKKEYQVGLKFYLN
jgi:TolB-like protein